MHTCGLASLTPPHNKAARTSYNMKNSRTLFVLASVGAVCSWTVCDGQPTFVYEPRNRTITAGEGAKFNCTYKGAFGTPVWNINGTVYYWSRLPSLYVLHFATGDFSITVAVATPSINNTYFQCVVDGVESSIGYLFVLPTPTSTVQQIYLPTTTSVNIDYPSTSTSKVAHAHMKCYVFHNYDCFRECHSHFKSS